MKKIIVGLFASTLLFSTAAMLDTQVSSADADPTVTETPGQNYIAFMIKGNAPVYSPSGMDLKMLAPIGDTNYEVPTSEIITLADGTILYPINSENQYVKSTDVVQAMNSETPIDWQVKPLNEVIHTKDLIGIPLYDENGQIIERRALSADSYWYTNGSKTDPKTNEVFYRVSTHEYVSADDIL